MNGVTARLQHPALRFFCFFFGLVSTQLACRVQPERIQMEAQYWGNPKVAQLQGTPAILF